MIASSSLKIAAELRLHSNIGLLVLALLTDECSTHTDFTVHLDLSNLIPQITLMHY